MWTNRPAPARRARSSTSWVPPTLTSKKGPGAPGGVDDPGGVDHRGAGDVVEQGVDHDGVAHVAHHDLDRRPGQLQQRRLVGREHQGPHPPTFGGEGPDQVLAQPAGGAGDDDGVGAGRVGGGGHAEAAARAPRWRRPKRNASP
jgi:hypothetical protein